MVQVLLVGKCGRALIAQVLGTKISIERYNIIKTPPVYQVLGTTWAQGEHVESEG